MENQNQYIKAIANYIRSKECRSMLVTVLVIEDKIPKHYRGQFFLHNEKLILTWKNDKGELNCITEVQMNGVADFTHKSFSLKVLEKQMVPHTEFPEWGLYSFNTPITFESQEDANHLFIDFTIIKTESWREQRIPIKKSPC